MNTKHSSAPRLASRQSARNSDVPCGTSQQGTGDGDASVQMLQQAGSPTGARERASLDVVSLGDVVVDSIQGREIGHQLSKENSGSSTGNALISACNGSEKFQARHYEEEDSWPPRQPSMAGDTFVDFLSKNLQGEAMPMRKDVEVEQSNFVVNEDCPFSHESLQSAMAVTLRCGHRFALEQLEIAKRGPAVCASAGFALKDALICPLCGDQDITTMPVASKILTCYSRNTDAYLRDSRKDYQKPLQLPMQLASDSISPQSTVRGGKADR
jgi:hypothetical protein